MDKNSLPPRISRKGLLDWLSVTAISGRPACASSWPTTASSSWPLSVRRRKQDPWPQLRRDLSRWRYRIDTIFGQLVERTAIKRIWAYDLWHLTSRLLRKVLMHTVAAFTNVALDRPPLHLACLIA
jgi:hypothetical protein